MIDIIITIYNTPITDLKRCFDSIKGQKYKEWNVILIDDGSKFEISNWLDKWCEENERFSIKHITNNGVSNARNVGLSLSNSEYVSFCDSDDALNENFLLEAMNIAKNQNIDIIMGGTRIVYSNRTEDKCSTCDSVYYNDEVNLITKYMLAGVTSKDNMELNNIFAGRIYPKVIKKELLNDVYFDTDIIMHEDNLFMLDILLKSKSIYVNKNIWYNYFQNDYSITQVKYSERLLNQEMLFIKKLEERRNIIENTEILDSIKIRIANTLLLYISRLKYSDKNISQELYDLFNDEIFLKIMDINTKKYNFSLKKKILISLLKLKNRRLKTILFTNLLKIMN